MQTQPTGTVLVPSSFQILVVDDEAANREVLGRRLERKGYRVSVAEDGRAAVAAIANRDFDLVLLDLMMPGMSGLEVLEQVRKAKGPLVLPIVMASASHETDDITRALQLGANDYVTKPLDFPVVFARVETQLRLRATSEALARSEARYRLLAQESIDLITVHDADGVVRYASPASNALLGLTPAEVEGRKIGDLLHPRDRHAVARQHASLPDTCTYVLRMRKVTGESVWVEMVSRTLRAADGAVKEVLTTSRDITAYVEHLVEERPPAAGGADFVGSTGWRTPAPDAVTPLESFDVAGEEAVIAHASPEVRRSLATAVRETSARPRRSLISRPHAPGGDDAG